MINVHYFEFSPFAENTYVLYDLQDKTKECIIVDPGCYETHEKEALKDYITKNGLKPIRLLNTHSHIDHVFGNKFVHDTYGLLPEMHKDELPGLQAVPTYGATMGLRVEPSPLPEKYLVEGDTVKLGNSELSVLFTPGHSIASISFYCEKDQFVIGGDVLFQGGIGRTDLPGGSYPVLIQSIAEKFLTLGDTVIVYSGHGPETTIGLERKTNPFLLNF